MSTQQLYRSYTPMIHYTYYWSLSDYIVVTHPWYIVLTHKKSLRQRPNSLVMFNTVTSLFVRRTSYRMGIKSYTEKVNFELGSETVRWWSSANVKREWIPDMRCEAQKAPIRNKSCYAVQLTYDHRRITANGQVYNRVQARLSTMAVQHAPHDNTG